MDRFHAPPTPQVVADLVDRASASQDISLDGTPLPAEMNTKNPATLTDGSASGSDVQSWISIASKIESPLDSAHDLSSVVKTPVNGNADTVPEDDDITSLIGSSAFSFTTASLGVVSSTHWQPIQGPASEDVASSESSTRTTTLEVVGSEDDLQQTGDIVSDAEPECSESTLPRITVDHIPAPKALPRAPAQSFTSYVSPTGVTSLNSSVTAQATSTAHTPTPTSPIVGPQCRLCSKGPTSPVTTMCGHVFCHMCIVAELDRNVHCPTCKFPIFVKLDFATT
ncbi:hypothetical protein EUX98_g1739 [Antrodiella citrinella]|uniref:RING-type domain-containing protein n=1 Tax=Antrodiella citrinella TaxID=2447956 RepID=A0A4S4N3N0_9APHY|nr:hypothetical protein EUX98_g1739 [Antrodiella citrinella]